MHLSHPFERIPPGRIRRYAVPLVVLVVLVGGPLLANVEAGPGVRGLTALALSGSPEAAAAILSGWSASDRIHIAFANGLDYLWGFLYANVMALACVWAGRVGASRPWHATASLLAWLSWLVAILDVPENISYYQMIRGVNRSPYPEILTACVAIRTAIFFCVLGFLAVAVRRRWASRPGLRRAAARGAAAADADR